MKSKERNQIRWWTRGNVAVWIVDDQKKCCWVGENLSERRGHKKMSERDKERKDKRRFKEKEIEKVEEC